MLEYFRWKQSNKAPCYIRTHLTLQEYKPPLPKDIPIDFRVNFLRNSPNPLGVLRSKGTEKKFLHATYLTTINLSIIYYF